MLELLSSGFQVTWFRESGRHLWLAVVKPSSEIGDHFGLRQECFVIGNGYPKDFHQRTLLQAPPGEMLERLDPAVRFVASDSAMADSFCAAWAQKNRASVVVFKGTVPSSLIPKEHLYSVLSSSLWRRDLFAEAEPVRLATEFFGRELVVNELLAKIVAGAPIGVFGLRKIGKSSLLGRVEDLLQQDQGSVSATAFLLGNASRLKSGRWWHVALDMLGAWQSKLQRLAGQLGSKIHAKADRLHDVVGKKAADTHVLASAFEKDVLALLKAARAIQTESGRDATRLVVFVDECDHLYPHLADAGHWRTDFFVLWNSLQTIKRSLEVPDELVYVLSGVNPSGVEQGSLQGQPNPLFETQRLYLGPMSEDDAGALLRGLGSRMGLVFDDDSVRDTYRLVGGHPLLLRRFGTAIHDANRNRASLKTIAASDVQRVFAKNKRDLFNQVAWILEQPRDGIS